MNFLAATPTVLFAHPAYRGRERMAARGLPSRGIEARLVNEIV